MSGYDAMAQLRTQHVLIGLTGGIGAGKSTVARELARLGALVVDADAIQRLVVAKGTPGLAQIVQTFGEQMLTEDGELNRPAMAQLVFSDDAARRQLEGITHPLIAQETQRQMLAAADGQVIVHDVPLLVELGFEKNYDLVVIVDAPAEDRVQRLVTDRGMTRDEAEARIRAQASDEQRRAVADVWLVNDSTPEVLAEKVREMWQREVAPRV